MELCSRCKISPRRSPDQRWCRWCHAEYMRENRPKHSELTLEQRMRANARSYAHVYRDRGKIPRKPCAVCAEEPAEMHHPDYGLPTKVIWLCRKHHLLVHPT